MSLVDEGLVKQFLDLIGIQITTASGGYIAFLVVSILIGLIVITFSMFLFKFLVYVPTSDTPSTSTSLYVTLTVEFAGIFPTHSNECF